MKKFLLSVVCAGLMASMFSGCAKEEQKSAPTAEEQKQAEIDKLRESLSDAPSWVIEPIVENGIAAVGAARYSKGGMSYMLPQAEMDAKGKLAARVQEEVSRLQQQSKRLVQTKDLDAYDSNFKEATEIVVKKMPLSGAKRIKTYVAKDGTLYTMVAIMKRDVANYLEDSKNQFKQDMEEAKMTREAIDEGMEVLDGTIAELRDAVN